MSYKSVLADISAISENTKNTVFDITTTEMSGYTAFLNKKDANYKKFAKGLQAEIVYN